MNRLIISRIMSIMLLGILLGLMIHQLEVKRNQMGRDAFLVEQGQRFDKMYANPPGVVPIIFVGVFFAGGFLGVYELMTYGFNLLLKRLEEKPT